MAFALLGTRVHLELARAAAVPALAEEQFEDDEMTGIIDYYEDEAGQGILTDYKTWGSYRVARALGIVKDEKPDPRGGVFRSGPRKGKPRTIPVFDIDPERAQNRDAVLQQNRYRLFLKDDGKRVDVMQIEAIVRDGLTQVAISRGVVKPIYLIPVRRMADHLVFKFFGEQTESLLRALGAQVTPEPCTDEERWDGRRCRNYCDVAQFCDVGREEMRRA